MKLRYLALTCLAISIATVSHAAFDRFQAYIGIDDGAKGRPGDGIFRVQVDGKEVFKSGVMRPGMPVKAIDIPIASAQKLGLFIDDEGNGHGGDWGNWLDARLVDSKTGKFVFLTDLTPEEKAWIGACRDRNVVRQPLRVGGITYLRGWGCISGSELVFKNWETAIQAKESQIDREYQNEWEIEDSSLVISAPLPDGVTLIVDGKPAQRKTPIRSNSQIQLDGDFSKPQVQAWLKAGTTYIGFQNTKNPLLNWIRPTERWIHEDFVPNRNVLLGDAKIPDKLLWGGKPLSLEGKRTIVIKGIWRYSKFNKAIYTERSYTFFIKAKPIRTSEVSNPEAITSSICKISIDGVERATLYSDDPASLNQIIQTNQPPKRLECKTYPGADGSLADGFIFDIIVEKHDFEILRLHNVAPSFQKFEYSQADKLVVSESWQIPGLGVVWWDNLQEVVDQWSRGQDLLASARQTILAAKTTTAIDQAVDGVIAIDPGQPEIRLAAAERYKQLGDLKQERRQLGLLLETTRADLKTVQQARTRIDHIWSQILASAGLGYQTTDFDDTPGQRMVSKPEELLPGYPNRKNGSYGETNGKILLGKPAGLLIGPSNKWVRTLLIGTGKSKKIAAMVNSRGVECTLTIQDGKKVLSTQTSRYPLVHFDVPTATKELTVTLSVDPDATGILLDHIMDLVVWDAPTAKALPSYNWLLRANVNSLVSTSSSTPIVFALPRTATHLKVTDGMYTLSEPTTEYLVQPDPKLGGNNLVVFAAPTKPGVPVQISYEWPDAIYNVPMSHFDWDRLNRVYLQTPAALLDTGKKSHWSVDETQNDWKLFTSTPAPTVKGKMEFDVENQAGLSIIWNAKDVMTSWIAMKHKNLTMYIPDNPNNRAWFPLWMSYVRQVYDKQVENTGFEKPNYLYIGVQGASMLSGYGGGTAGDDHTSETWLPATGRCSPYFWMHADSPSGVDSHELHWVHYGCFVEDLPVWVTNGFGGWIEETGWRCTELANSENYMRVHRKNAAAAIELIRSEGKNPMQSSQEQWDALPGPTREKMISLGWLISEELYNQYGKDFWAKFWKEQRDQNKDAYKKLSPKERDIFFVNELVRVSKDPSLKERFEKEWGINLTP